ncbi:MAG: RHS repeat protein, partial [Fimbriimonadaceae bacterium]|nr:RHS repeat protein [Fimbriimonadaceae bacterium]
MQMALECGLNEPLVELGGRLAAPEADSLRKALEAYRQHALDTRFQGDPLAELSAFCKQYPHSPVIGSLELNLGLRYRLHGYNRRSLEALKSSWERLKGSPDARGHDLANRALGEYCLTLSYLGRCEDLERALQEGKGRKLHGSSTELIAGATEALDLMKKHPEASFRCGPLALARLVRGKQAESAIAKCSSTRKGTSLARVYQLSQECKMAYQMAFRSPGAPILERAVMHWKAGHFGALVERKGDRYLVEDSTSIATPLYVAADCLEQEASGYFLIPAGPLPKGWRSVGLAEAQTVWGCGVTPEKDENATTEDDKKGFDDEPCEYMTRWNVHSLLVSLTLSDIPVGLSPAKFAVPFKVTYAQRERNQPTTFTYSNLGNKWSFNFLSIVNDLYASTGRCYVYQPGGGAEEFYFHTSPNTSQLSPLTSTFLQRNPGTSCILTARDGSQRIYEKVVGNQYFMTRMVDAQGNTTRIHFDEQNRITSVVDPSNRTMTFTYGLASDPLKITQVTDPFGRSATFSYTDGQLTSITDVLGITSSYQYGANDFIQALTTPYGTTQFAYADKSTDPTLDARRILTVVDPAGRNYRVEFRNQAPGIPFSETVVPEGMSVYNFYIDSRNSFAWGPHQLAGGTIDYTKATITHFLHRSGSFYVAARTPESIKKPEERRVWFDYGQPSPGFEAPVPTILPVAIGRVHSDGTTQIKRYEYSPQGNITKIVDPTGRNFLMNYAPGGIDLLSVTTGGKTLMSATYDTQHNLVSLTSASGGTSAFSYDARGLLTSLTNSLGQTTTYSYTQTGNLASINEPLQKTTTFSYDSAERVASATDSEGYTVQAAYDAGDRPVSVTFPDGTQDQLTYSRLDVVETRDRLGRTTQMGRDSLGRLTSLTDANGGVTSLDYGWEDAPHSLTDPKGNTTNFQFDLQQRMIAKQLPGGATQSVIYEQCLGRIYRITDELGASKTFNYFPDNQLKSITYSGATPAVNFTQDTFLPRPLTMTDGTGTTSFAYGEVGAPGANQVTSITGPYGDSASFQYDVAGRPLSQTVNGSAENVTYDDLWRPTSTTNALDTFNMSYLGKTGQVTGVNSTSGPSTTYAYAPNAQDRRLTQI